MKSPKTLCIALAFLATACGDKSILSVPPSIPVSQPAIPADLDRDPNRLGAIEDATLGGLAVKSSEDSLEYGRLAVRYNTLRAYVKCVIAQVNTHTSPESCVK